MTRPARRRGRIRRLVSGSQKSSRARAPTTEHGATTNVCPSTAYVRLAAVFTSGPSAWADPRYSEKAGHAPTWISSPSPYIAYLVSGWRGSQQLRAPTFPSGVSWTWRSFPSPSPNTERSTWVGVSLRRTETGSPVSGTNAWAMYGLPPERSLNPRTTWIRWRAAAPRIRSISAPSRVIELVR